MFEGDDPRLWITKCKRYFVIYEVDENKKVELESLILVGKAEIWYQN